MRSTWTPTEKQLKAYAETHIEYEVRMLLQQHQALLTLDKKVQAKKIASIGASGQALLEASLVHLRLLDDFLGSPNQALTTRSGDKDDVFARHWVPQWKPKTFLTMTARRRVNAQVAHLSGRRRSPGVQPNEITAYLVRCCLALRAFFRAIDKHDSHRGKAFAVPKQHVETFLKSHGL